MRSPLVAAALLAAAPLAPLAAQADAPREVRLPVGAKLTIGGYAGLCDDPSVATITLADEATITALKAGTTLCSSKLPGGRQVIRVVVEAAPKK